ncbi:DUF6412 domain-containing protein [Amycolatopsis minnesotensis]|uniref:Uncharacterized protein n=1 Tax=Amycolatopsis minnesotensis TaxID=337894 RepID=A0ABN2R5X8_9PSEU
MLRLMLVLTLPVTLGALLLADPANPLAVAGVALLAAFTVTVAVAVLEGRLDPPDAPPRVRAMALRQRAARSRFLRLRDPDAAGRPRPRAPSAGHAAV